MIITDEELAQHLDEYKIHHTKNYMGSLKVQTKQGLIMDVTFKKIMITGFDASNVTFSNCLFRDCSMPLSNFRDSIFYNCKFHVSGFQTSDFSGAQFYNCEFVICDLHTSNFENTIFRDAFFDHANFLKCFTLGWDCTVCEDSRDLLWTRHIGKRKVSLVYYNGSVSLGSRVESYEFWIDAGESDGVAGTEKFRALLEEKGLIYEEGDHHTFYRWLDQVGSRAYTEQKRREDE